MRKSDVLILFPEYAKVFLISVVMASLPSLHSEQGRDQPPPPHVEVPGPFLWPAGRAGGLAGRPVLGVWGQLGSLLPARTHALGGLFTPAPRPSAPPWEPQSICHPLTSPAARETDRASQTHGPVALVSQKHGGHVSPHATTPPGSPRKTPKLVTVP